MNIINQTPEQKTELLNNLHTLSTEDKNKYKQQIISYLYQLPELMVKLKGILFRNGCKDSTLIFEDAYNETFVHIINFSNKSDDILEMYLTNERRCVALFTVIAVRKIVSSNKTDKNYYRHSLLKFMSWTSNMFQHEHIEPCDNYDDENGFSKTFIDDSEETNEQKLWNLIMENLDAESLQDLDMFLNMKKRQGRYQKATKQKLNDLLDKIKTIVVDHQINVPGPLHKSYKKETFNSHKNKLTYLEQQKQLFDSIASLLPILKEYRSRGSANMNVDQKLLLQDIFREIQPNVRIDLSCSQCLMFTLSVAESYYEREHPKFINRVAKIEEPEPVMNVVQDDPTAPKEHAKVVTLKPTKKKTPVKRKKAA